MNIFGPLPKTKQGSQFVVVITDRYTKRTKAIPTTKNATTVARILLEHWVAYYAITSKLLTDNGSQIVSEIRVVMCGTLGVDNISTSDTTHKLTALRIILTLL